MIKIFPAFIFCILFASCKKDDILAPPSNPGCGRAGRVNGTWMIRFEVTGTVSPDSVIFNMNAGQSQFGTQYYKKFLSPALSLTDSLNYCGEKHSEPILYVYHHDTTKTFTGNIYVNNILRQTSTNNSYLRVVEIINY